MPLFHSGAFVITVGDVVLKDITNNAKNQATFIMYVYIKEGKDALDSKILEVCSPSPMYVYFYV